MVEHYKRWQPLNKVNLCWVISEGRIGHEKQSLALANLLAHRTICHRFSSTFLQRLSAPRSLFHRWQSTTWQAPAPDASSSPELIISCGRHAAAAAAQLRKTAGGKHLQILNPKGNLSRYDCLLLPSHDLVSTENSCIYQGSLHDIKARPQPENPLLAVMIGNPHHSFWPHWKEQLAEWKSLQLPLFICGSPRLGTEAKSLIRKSNHGDSIWLDESDGQNPYQQLIASASHFAVSSDSINMINECYATGQKVEIFGQSSHLSSRHQRFLSAFDQHQSGHNHPWEQPLEAIKRCEVLQKLLNSPTSSNGG